MVLIKNKLWILKRERKPVDEWWMPESGLPDFTNRLSGFEAENELCRSGFPDAITSWPVVFQKAPKWKTAFRLIRSGIPVKLWKIFLKFCKLLDLYYTHQFIFSLKIDQFLKSFKFSISQLVHKTYIHTRLNI